MQISDVQIQNPEDAFFFGRDMVPIRDLPRIQVSDSLVALRLAMMEFGLVLTIEFGHVGVDRCVAFELQRPRGGRSSPIVRPIESETPARPDVRDAAEVDPHHAFTPCASGRAAVASTALRRSQVGSGDGRWQSPRILVSLKSGGLGRGSSSKAVAL